MLSESVANVVDSESLKERVMNRWWYCFVIFLWIGKGTAQIPVIKIPPVAQESIALSDIAECVVREVRLEQVEDVWLSSVRRMMVDGKNLFLRDYRQGQVFRFDVSGKFLNRIGQIGHGPNEYLYLKAFCVDPDLKQIYLMTEKGIKSYDYEGNVKDEYSCIRSLSSGSLCCREGLLYALGEEFGRRTKEGKYQNITTLYRFSSRLQILDSVFFQCVTQDRDLFSTSGKEMNFSINGYNLFLYKAILTGTFQYIPDTLYRWENGKILPFLRLDFGRVEVIRGMKNMRIVNVFRTRRFLFCNYLNIWYDDFWCCYDFQRQVCMHSSKKFRDDLLNFGEVELFPLDLDRGLMYFVKQSYELEGMTENDNPVLYIVELKK